MTLANESFELDRNHWHFLNNLGSAHKREKNEEKAFYKCHLFGIITSLE